MIVALLVWFLGSDPEVAGITFALALALTFAFRATRHLLRTWRKTRRVESAWQRSVGTVHLSSDAQPGLNLALQTGMIDSWRWRPQVVKQKHPQKVRGRASKSVPRLPDLEIAKSAVLNSLSRGRATGISPRH